MEPREGSYPQFVRCVVAESVTGVASHFTAAHLHGIPLPFRVRRQWMSVGTQRTLVSPLDLVHITVPPEHRAPRRRGTKGHASELQPEEITEVGGIAVTSLARTILDLAQYLSEVDLIVALDHLFSSGMRSLRLTKKARLPRQVLLKYLAKKRGTRGIRRLMAAIDRAVDGADSPPETKLRLALEDAGCPFFHANMPIHDEHEQPIAWPDLANFDFKVCVEYEGAHHLTADQLHSDASRDMRVQMNGWLQIRLTKVDLRNMEIAVEKVKSALRKRGWTPFDDTPAAESARFPP